MLYHLKVKYQTVKSLDLILINADHKHRNKAVDNCNHKVTLIVNKMKDH
jgi:quercetin dioxygenase-like cupin family protein